MKCGAPVYFNGIGLSYTDANGNCIPISIRGVGGGGKGKPGPPGPPGPSGVNAWLLSGNTGTVDGVNFLGTIDNVPLTFRTNNSQSGRIEPSGATANTFFGFTAGNANTGIANTGMGWGALQLNTTGNNNTAFGTNAICCNLTGSNNTGVGEQALRQLLSGSGNTAIGAAALNNNTASNNTAVGQGSLQQNGNGTQNVAVGNSSLNQNTVGINNTASGAQSLNQNTTGNDNISIGFQSLQNSNGDQNVAIGSGAGSSNTAGSGNVFIGFQSGDPALPNQNNTLYINNSASATPLIFGDFAGNHLVFNADIATSNPGGGAGVWKLGTVLAGVVTADLANYVEITIGGATVKLIKAV